MVGGQCSGIVRVSPCVGRAVGVCRRCGCRVRHHTTGALNEFMYSATLKREEKLPLLPQRANLISDSTMAIARFGIKLETLARNSPRWHRLDAAQEWTTFFDGNP